MPVYVRSLGVLEAMFSGVLTVLLRCWRLTHLLRGGNCFFTDCLVEAVAKDAATCDPPRYRLKLWLRQMRVSLGRS
ncbi:hypothetical protein EV426DRAFT_295191 [Tirmania nivea]|nr:hypothetical protein EV426DRAFT_295191 [Tirmania nivea]